MFCIFHNVRWLLSRFSAAESAVVNALSQLTRVVVLFSFASIFTFLFVSLFFSELFSAFLATCLEPMLFILLSFIVYFELNSLSVRAKIFPRSKRTLCFSHWQKLMPCSAILSQDGVAKLMASAMLNPTLNPLWYACALQMTNSRGIWTILCSFIPCFSKTDGSKSTVLCLKNSGHCWNSSGKCAYTSCSNFLVLLMSRLYQTLGAPACR